MAGGYHTDNGFVPDTQDSAPANLLLPDSPCGKVTLPDTGVTTDKVQAVTDTSTNLGDS